jgi:ferric-dicitrate binding protein FerR (iron transport regulator)
LNFQKFRNLTPEQREQLKQRFQKWQKMSPEEKTKVQENFRHWKQLSPQEREEMRKQHAQRPPASGDAPPSGPLSPAVKAVPAAAQSR